MAETTREVLPLSYPEPIRPGQIVRVKGIVKRTVFQPERLFISAAGTPGGAGDWFIEDVQVEGKTQLVEKGGISGIEFSTTNFLSSLKLDVVPMGGEVSLFVKYVGPNSSGVPFFSSLVGIAVVDQEKPETD